jgi:hypothetical protein
MFPRDMVCLRNISVHTLHKGDAEDNNNNNNNNNFWDIFLPDLMGSVPYIMK